MSEPLTDDEITAWPTRVDPMCGCAGEPHTCHSDSDTLQIMQLVRERDRARDEVRRLRARELTDAERQTLERHVEWLRTFDRAAGSFRALAVLDKLLGEGSR